MLAFDGEGEHVIRETVDAQGTWREEVDPAGRVLTRELLAPSLAYQAELDAAAAAAAARSAKLANNATRIETLGRRAARFAKDPVTNASDNFLPGVWATATTAQRNDIRVLHELLARLALAAVADDV